MNTTTLYFILFSVLAVFIYYILNHKYRVLFLTILSCGFIATYSYVLLAYVLAYVLVNYLIGIRISDGGNKKWALRIGLILNLTQLILLKYASFTINPIFDVLGVNADATIISRIIIPVGVSFFTLQGIGYLVNIIPEWILALAHRLPPAFKGKCIFNK